MKVSDYKSQQILSPLLIDELKRKKKRGREELISEKELWKIGFPIMHFNLAKICWHSPFPPPLLFFFVGLCRDFLLLCTLNKNNQNTFLVLFAACNMV